MPHFESVAEKLARHPVNTIAADVVRDTLSGKVTVLAAPTGSGKSMLVPARLADAADAPVIVLMPRRDLTIDAATNVADLAGVKLGEEVGYAVGAMAGDSSRKSPNSKLIFMTYGYALSSGILKTAKHIVLDEVHERSEDISLVRAVLHARKMHDPALTLLEMSATVNAAKQAAYWSDISSPVIHAIEGQSIPCDEREESPKDADKRSLEQATIDLIRHEGRKGIAVFRPGIREIENTVEELKKCAAKAGIKNLEIASIYSGTPPDERHQAKLPPKAGSRKILVGTNVIESGLNLRWLDAGVSDGKGKIPYTREDTGAKALVLEDLPKWRILQQRGRVNRDPAYSGFDSGIFLLHSERGWEFRPEQNTPEIERVALTNLAFRAASLGYDPTQLQFDGKVTSARIAEAKEALIRLQLITPDWSLTEHGRYASRLPITPEAGAMLCEARALDANSKTTSWLPDAIILAAFPEEGLRDDSRKSHGQDATSDMLDSLKIYKQLMASSTARFVTSVPDSYMEAASDEERAGLKEARERLKAQCASVNVHYNMFCATARMVREITSRHNERELRAAAPTAPDGAYYDGLKQCILAGGVNRLFHGSNTYQDLLRNYGKQRNNAGQPFNNYSLSISSCVDDARAGTPLIAGTLRETSSKFSGDAETVITNATAIPASVFIRWASARGDVLYYTERTTERGTGSTKPSQTLDARYFGKAHFSLSLPKLTPELSSQLERLEA